MRRLISTWVRLRQQQAVAVAGCAAASSLVPQHAGPSSGCPSKEGEESVLTSAMVDRSAIHRLSSIDDEEYDATA